MKFETTGACPYNRPCAQQYVGKSQSCMVISGRLIVHAPAERGGDSIEACQVALANGGFYGPWTDLNWYSTPPTRGMANHSLLDHLYVAILRLLSEEKVRVQRTFQYWLPKIATTLARKWDTCSPGPETPGILANGFKLDKVLIPVFLALSFWKHCIGVALCLWFVVWLMRQHRDTSPRRLRRPKWIHKFD